ncbi:MAG TPA: cytochrome b/b6 domain-containing protein [Acidobacteriota bacterium]|nr:cytochrome b/b6 domain-containing protein [Acidobacteriota bacterium]
MFTRIFILLIALLAAMPAASALQAQEMSSEEAQEACLTCHGDESLSRDESTRRLYVELQRLVDSVHGIFSCTDCHQDLAGVDPFGHDSPLQKVDCGLCHYDAQEEYSESLHAYALQRGNERAPGCASCHGSHNVLSVGNGDARSHIPEMCAGCHGQAGLLTDQLVRMPQAVQSYARSVHGQAFARGISAAATCTDCHGVHALKGVLDPQSRIHPQNVAETCGACHNEESSQYERSIHGRALATGIADSPTCNDCHGEHLILPADHPEASTYAASLAEMTCGNCHEDPRIIQKYGLADYVVSTYVDSYHGWSLRWEGMESANCVSCHTAHWVLPARDPNSTISDKNVVQTCRQCHENADASFASSYTHKTASVGSHPVTRWLEWIYLILIPVVIGGMLLHNAVVLSYYLMEKRRHELAGETVLRMDRVQLWQHILLAVSFIALVITGFALRFPDAFWVKPLAAVGMSEAWRSWIHRVMAIVMMGVGISHFLYVWLSRRGRREFRAMIPGRKDLADFFDYMRYHLGLRKEPARFGRYDYTQKAEYWALVWGTAVMALSGLVLWFPAASVRWFPSWVVQASEVLHYYEAWLAMLAILVWHFFFVLLHPAAYPMSWAWLTGRMSKDEVRHLHPEWYREMEEEARRKKEEEPKAEEPGSGEAPA